MKSVTRVLLCWLVFGALPLSYLEAVVQTAGLHVARGIGLAAIYDNNIPQAQYEAKASARVNALESLGVRVTSKAYSDHKSILDQTVLQRTQGYISEERVIQEGSTAEGLYEVVIEAWIDTIMTADEVEKRRRNLLVALDLPERIRHQDESASGDHPDRVVQEMLKDALIERGFQAFTLRDIRELLAMRGSLAEMVGTPESLSDLSNLTMAGVLVHGEVESRFSEALPQVEDYFGKMQQGLFYRAFPRIKASDAYGGAIPKGNIYIAEGVKGANLSPDRSAREALVECGKVVIDRLVGGLSAYAQQHQVTFSVEVRGLRNVGQYRRYKRILENLMHVVEVQAVEAFSVGEKAVYLVTYQEKPFLLMSQIHRIPGLVVEQFSGLSVKARYTEE